MAVFLVTIERLLVVVAAVVRLASAVGDAVAGVILGVRLSIVACVVVITPTRLVTRRR